ncbi:hypothetical protein LXL04_015976 [Taraxacum kok-saghyz]
MAKSSADDLELRRACEAAIEGTDQKVGLSIRVGKSRGVWGKAGKIGKGQMAKPRVLAISTKEKTQEIKVFLHVLKYSNGGVLEVKKLPEKYEKIDFHSKIWCLKEKLISAAVLSCAATGVVLYLHQRKADLCEVKEKKSTDYGGGVGRTSSSRNFPHPLFKISSPVSHFVQHQRCPINLTLTVVAPSPVAGLRQPDTVLHRLRGFDCTPSSLGVYLQHTVSSHRSDLGIFDLICSTYPVAGSLRTCRRSLRSFDHLPSRRRWFGLNTHRFRSICRPVAHATPQLLPINLVVDFTATSCGICGVIAQFYAELAKNMPLVAFLKVEVD